MALEQPNFNLLSVRPKLKQTKISAASISSPLNSKRSTIFARGSQLGPKLRSSTLSKALSNQEFLQAPSIPKPGEGVNEPNLIYRELIETNRILVEVQNQLAIDFATRIAEKKDNLALQKKLFSKQKFAEEEDSLEKINKDTSFLNKAFAKVTKPAKNVFKNILDFFKALAAAIAVTSAFKWLSNENNRKKLKQFFDFIGEHWKWIVGIIAGGLILGGILKLVGAAIALRNLWNWLTRRPPLPRGGSGGLGGGIPCLPIRCVPELAASRVLKMAMASAAIMEALKRYPFLEGLQGKATIPGLIPEEDRVPGYVTQPAFALAMQEQWAKVQDAISVATAGFATSSRLDALSESVNNLSLEGIAAPIEALKGTLLLVGGDLVQVTNDVFAKLGADIQVAFTRSKNFIGDQLVQLRDSMVTAFANVNWQEVGMFAFDILSLIPTIANFLTPAIAEPVSTSASIANITRILMKVQRLMGFIRGGQNLGIIPSGAKGGSIKGKKKACCTSCLGFSRAQLPQYALGGGELFGPPHSEGGMDINVEGGEYLVNKRDASYFRSVLDDINFNGGKMWNLFTMGVNQQTENNRKQLEINNNFADFLSNYRDVQIASANGTSGIMSNFAGGTIPSSNTTNDDDGRNWLQKFWDWFVPPPEESNEPSVRAGVRTPQTGFSHVPSMSGGTQLFGPPIEKDPLRDLSRPTTNVVSVNETSTSEPIDLRTPQPQISPQTGSSGQSLIIKTFDPDNSWLVQALDHYEVEPSTWLGGAI